MVVVETMRWWGGRLLPTHTIIRSRDTLKIQLLEEYLKHLARDTLSDAKRAQTGPGDNRLSVTVLQ